MVKKDAARKRAEELQAQIDWLAGTHVHGETCEPCEKMRQEVARLFAMRPASEYHEDFGIVLWWALPIDSPPEVGMGEMGVDQGGGYTHWTPLPDCKKMAATDGAPITTEDLLG